MFILPWRHEIRLFVQVRKQVPTSNDLLVHNASLSITISIFLRVQFVHQAWLLACRIARAGRNASASEVLIVVVPISGRVILSQRGSSLRACAAESTSN